MREGIVFTPEVRDELRVAYNEALEEGVDTFEFMEVEFVVGYAKYLLEFLDMRLQAVH